MKNVLYNPIQAKFKAPIGGLNTYEECIINIYLNRDYNIYNFKLVINPDNYNQEFNYNNELIYTLDYKSSVYIDGNLYNEFSAKFKINKPYLYFYHFEYSDCYGTHFIGCDEYLDAYITDDVPVSFQLNVSDKVSSKLDWYKGKVMYQIYLDRFNKSDRFNNLDLSYKYNYYIHKSFDEDIIDKPINGEYHVDFYGGDIIGLINKLDYLKEMNVGVIYLNPIFLSPTSHKYNTSNYLLIDPMYGTIFDFKLLITEAKKRNIYIILDGVFNHTGDDSIYFNKYNHFDSIGAYNSSESKYYNWYDFYNYSENIDNYRSWWGIKTLPCVNQNSEFVKFITGSNGVIDTWMKTGIKGFRLDVVDEINDEFVTKINRIIKDNDNDSIIIGEVWNDASNKISYSKRRKYFNGHELDSVMNYQIKDGIIDYLRNNNLNTLVKKLRYEINNYNKYNLNLLMNILDTHDTPRILTLLSNTDFNNSNIDKLNYRLDNDNLNIAIKKVKMAYIILYTIPGIPCIYYGDEALLEGFNDPYCRRAMNWNNLNNSIKLLLDKLGELRKDNLFIDGIYNEISFNNNVFIYERYNDNNKYLIIINNSNYEYIYYNKYDYELLDFINNKYIKNNLVIEPYNGAIIKIY